MCEKSVCSLCVLIYMLTYSYWITTRNASLLIDGLDDGLITGIICTLNPSGTALHCRVYISAYRQMCSCKWLQCTRSLTPPASWGRTEVRSPTGLWGSGWRARSSPEEPSPSLMGKDQSFRTDTGSKALNQC